MTQATVFAVQHAPCETPGLIADVLQANGVALEYLRPFKGDRIPRRMGAHAGLVVVGGPMGVYEQQEHPFLRQEIRLIQDAVSEHRPILGVCLGSQLLAAALGAPVTRGKQKEIGWHPVTLGRAAAHDVLWRGLPESFVAYHWHGDVFELPLAATPLAWSKLTDCQAFRHGDSAYGFLFHLEVTERIIQQMTRTFRRELREAGLNERHVLDGVAEHLPPLHALGRTVFERWAALVKGEREGGDEEADL
jgi:GMP synthase (glutamine-hydrolysing)